jgi:hypothetical protein
MKVSDEPGALNPYGIGGPGMDVVMTKAPWAK